LTTREKLRDAYASQGLRMRKYMTGSMHLPTDIAEDLLQDVFLRAFVRANEGLEFANDKVMIRYLYRALLNAAITEKRRYHRWAKLQAQLRPPPQEIDGLIEQRDTVRHAAAHLTPKLRQVSALHWGAGLTRDQIAEKLGLPSGTVGSRLASAMVIMREAV
jgi:RNA polymerase sigma factor (sigma-70 family)